MLIPPAPAQLQERLRRGHSFKWKCLIAQLATAGYLKLRKGPRRPPEIQSTLIQLGENVKLRWEMIKWPNQPGSLTKQIIKRKLWSERLHTPSSTIICRDELTSSSSTPPNDCLSVIHFKISTLWRAEPLTSEEPSVQNPKNKSNRNPLARDTKSLDAPHGETHQKQHTLNLRLDSTQIFYTRRCTNQPRPKNHRPFAQKLSSCSHKKLWLGFGRKPKAWVFGAHKRLPRQIVKTPETSITCRNTYRIAILPTSTLDFQSHTPSKNQNFKVGPLPASQQRVVCYEGSRREDSISGVGSEANLASLCQTQARTPTEYQSLPWRVTDHHHHPSRKKKQPSTSTTKCETPLENYQPSTLYTEMSKTKPGPFAQPL